MAERLFQPLKFGALRLAHRIALAPLTRFRADDNHVPKRDIVAEYYAQRASVPGTLLITEATFISPQAGGYDYVPGIWSQEQVSAWKEVTDAVHAKGSFIFCQLWALGRVADPKVLSKTGHRPVSSSAIAISAGQEPPIALTEDDIQDYIQQYVHAAKSAIAAGFDGVEIHGANGYLLDQFLQDVINQRTDRWGGSIENRSRFHVEVTKAVIAAIGKERVGVRLNPFTQFQPGNVTMKDPIPQFTHVIKELKKLDIAFLDLIEPRMTGKGPVDGVYASSEERQLEYCLKAWGGEKPVLVAGGYTADKAREIADVHYKDYEVIVAFGRLYISTPDLPFRVQKGIDLNPYNRKTFYTHGAEGYTDYPFSKEFTNTSKI